MRKQNIPMYVACVLLCLTLITTYMTSGLYARYTAQAEGYDSARVARFDITETTLSGEERLQYDITPGQYDGSNDSANLVRTVQVTNNSEVVVKYVVSIDKITTNIPGLNFMLYESDVVGNNSKTGSNLLDNNYYLEPGQSHIYSLYAEWNVANALDYMGMVDLIELQFRAEQVD